MTVYQQQQQIWVERRIQQSNAQCINLKDKGLEVDL
jgi:hypothetical protein